MEDIREVLKMFEPTMEVINSLINRNSYIVMTKTGQIADMVFFRFKTVEIKFKKEGPYHDYYTKDELKYIFKKKENGRN
jgi:hypothetical protein